ncbi:cystathionine gamma-synthase family protein [Hyphococcus flavus]|uniref:Cystathionine gamma-synthase family protein n=1 Tax=Hyphococcus flavus TaxID=1866326 RepID=A0AAE9ZCC3_9PROT|nr:cystathionine gamma-synthase family protein [Hyphococcus flavus]WDI31816.1 cystathionine gamma-synthase family protein [Hyphococcus flavus]
MSNGDKKYKARILGNRQLSPETLMMGYGFSPELSEGSLKPPVFHTSTFVFQSAEEGKAFFELAYGLRQKEETEEIGLIYSRINNPNLEVLEDRLAVWDKAEKSLVFASGMAAISTSLWSYLTPGDALVHSEPVYGGTEYLVHNILPSFGIKRVGFNAEEGTAGMNTAVADAKKLADETGGRVGAIYLETPANPTNGLVDIAAARKHSEALAKDGKRPPVIVDNTFLGPLWQTPLELGADLTVTSLTKYVGGHSDLIAGSCSGAESWTGPVQVMRTILGTMGDAHTGWMLLRSLETLKLRMEASTTGARKVADFLHGHDKVKSVWYLDYLPKDHPDREIYDRQCGAPGSTFSFEVNGGEAEAFKVLNALKIIKLAVSLGGTETLASHPAAMTHSDVPPKERLRLGITEALIRISVGVEDPDDLIADLDQALAAI